MNEIVKTSAENQGLGCNACGVDIYKCEECGDYFHENEIIYCQEQEKHDKHWCEECGKERLENGK